MEPLTSVNGGRRAWPGYALIVLVFASGSSVAATLISGVGSLVTWPMTQELRFAHDRYELFNLELLLVFLVAVIGLNLLKQAGLISIGVTAIFGVGAYFVAIATVDWGWSYWLALPVATAIGGLLGTALGVPALRLGVFAFAMVTLGYAFVFEDLTFEWQGLTGGPTGLGGIEYPRPFDTLESYYWFLALTTAATFIVAHNYLRSPGGRAAKAVAERPVAAQSLGISQSATKMKAFAVSSLCAGLAGGLYAPLVGFVAPDSFTVHFAVLFVLMVILGGVGTTVGPVIGGLLLFRIPIEIEQVAEQPGEWSLLIYGSVLLVAVYLFPRGLVGAWWQVRTRIPSASRPETATARDRDRAEVDGVVRAVESDGRPMVKVSGVAKNLGGLAVLDGVAIDVLPGSVHALIGPNGSGKTTFLNTLSGYVVPDRGVIELFGRPVGRSKPYARSRAGLARTFQTPMVFEEMTCVENVMTALDHGRRRSLVSYALRLPPARGEERRCYERATRILAAVGLGARRDVAASSLPPGERRLLELARVVALEPRAVLMDEPAAGLSRVEIDELEGVIRALRAKGIAVLLVEHHVDFVMRLADVVTVIDFGRVIAHGAPGDVRSDPAVVTAYLGVDDATAAPLDGVRSPEASAAGLDSGSS